MRAEHKSFTQVMDVFGFRIVVGTVADCYHALGVIHHHWTPLQERIKDYIASPKSNAYQSLHTTIFGPGGQLYEIQIRTREMHRTAEFGIAAHWVYKEGKKSDALDTRFAWFRQLLELQQDARSPQEFLEFLKVDLYQDEIFVFTPKGDVKQLPKGATAIDFAFHVHTEVGLHCHGCKINGRIAPLHRPLRNGDTIEVLTSPQAKPSRDWLAHVQTGRARQKIRQWIKQEEQERSVTLGREILAREVRRRRLAPPTPEQLAQAAQTLSLGVAEQVEASIGRGDVQLGQVTDENPKPKRASLPKGMKPEEVTLDVAVGLLSLPRLIGVHATTGAKIYAGQGRFGPYVVCDRGKEGKEYRSLKKEVNVLTVSLPRALAVRSMKPANPSSVVASRSPCSMASAARWASGTSFARSAGCVMQVASVSRCRAPGAGVQLGPASNHAST